MATVQNDAEVVLLADANDERSSLRIVNRSVHHLDVFLNSAEPATRIASGSAFEVDDTYSGPVQGRWAEPGAGHAIVCGS